MVPDENSFISDKKVQQQGFDYKILGIVQMLWIVDYCWIFINCDMS